MRKNYVGMLKLLVIKNVFKKGEIIDRFIFGKRINELGLRKEFRKEYSKGYSYMLYWNLWDFSDRFNRFMKKCDIFEYLGNGKYLVK